ncbi:DNA-binding protein [Rheinheimera sp. YQF-2]|uniref:DNA-binding protein n=1 Tax=Rheinheimera lutimaris TaxID=2740584 RepID=A0A7Y5ELM3_9GAMM|nr:DNA-binding protein [Rheinheimera lutimaris]NRQ43348.1 DNA-binding protein [Rheinheimera lutimaris]
MTLDNLIGKSLERIEPDSTAIQRLLEAAQRNLKDAELTGLSNETRFDAAYKAIMQLANSSLQASGFRTLTSKPGHHQTLIQSLVKTVGIETDRMIVLDALRKQRNITDYSGDLVEDAAVTECLLQARYLLETVTVWLHSKN